MPLTDLEAFNLFTYTRTFNAIAAATTIEAGGSIGISVAAFKNNFMKGATDPIASHPAERIGQLITEAMQLAPSAGLFLKIRVEPARTNTDALAPTSADEVEAA
jgi:hypothetical protein